MLIVTSHPRFMACTTQAIRHVLGLAVTSVQDLLTLAWGSHAAISHVPIMAMVLGLLTRSTRFSTYACHVPSRWLDRLGLPRHASATTSIHTARLPQLLSAPTLSRGSEHRFAAIRACYALPLPPLRPDNRFVLPYCNCVLHSTCPYA